MQRSTDRILTTHTGSLPRPDDLTSLLEGQDQRQVGANPQFEERVKQAVAEVVQHQVDCGVDVVNDGEASKVSYATYVTARLSGFDGAPRAQPPRVETRQFPAYYAERGNLSGLARPSCTGPITWVGDAQVQRDIANLKAALQGKNATEGFMSAASPGVVWHFLENDYYPSHEAYVFAVADAMRHEYQAIVDAGLVLQLDCPDLGMGWGRYNFTDSSVADFRKVAEMHVAALNQAIKDLPSDRVRVHLCWGNFEGPHTRDIPLEQIIDIVYNAQADVISFEGANPRHEHEWTVFRGHPLPDGKAIMPGVLDSTTNYVEHPEVVAQRLERYAGVVGKENVMAGSDCGFATAARSQPMVHPEVTWAKLSAMAEGAKLASQRLWG